MKPLIANASNTIGLCDMNNPKDHFVGQWQPSLLKSWAEQVLANFGDEPVYLAVHTCEDPMNTARILTTSAEYGDSLQVVVCGLDNDDVIKKGNKNVK